jgi:hypothetical protein
LIRRKYVELGRPKIEYEGLANIECRLAKFNKCPRHKSQLLAKTGPIVAQQGKNNKERWTKLKELSRMAVL